MVGLSSVCVNSQLFWALVVAMPLFKQYVIVLLEAVIEFSISNISVASRRLESMAIGSPPIVHGT